MHLDTSTAVSVVLAVFTTLLSGYVGMFRFVVTQWKVTSDAERVRMTGEITELKNKVTLLESKVHNVEVEQSRLINNDMHSTQTATEIKSQLKEVIGKLDHLTTTLAMRGLSSPGMKSTP